MPSAGRATSVLLALVLAVVAACSGGAGSKAGAPTTTTTSTSTTLLLGILPAAPETTTTTTTTPVPPAQPRVPSDPAELGRQLVADELVVRDASAAAADVDAAARRAQVAYRRLGFHPEWDAVVLPLVPAELQTGVTKNIDARRRFVAMAADTETQDSLPSWRIVAPAPADELLSYYREAEQQFGVGWSYLAAINLVETGLGRIQGLSSAGAQGPMQFMPSTWDAYGAGGNVDAPHDAILGAARYLAANGFADGNVDGSLYRYNNSTDYVEAVKDYAVALAAEPATFRAYHAWDIYYFTTRGDVLLPVGYEHTDRVPVDDYLATHPQ